MDILLTGGSGRLGTAIQKQIKCIAPSRKELDITRLNSCIKVIKKYKPDLVIHCAGYVNSLKAEVEQEKCFKVNVTGTMNMVDACDGIRFIYISSDYVFNGDKGNYSEKHLPNPTNFYGLTKYLGESITRYCNNTLVIRTAFKNLVNGRFEHNKAFKDQYTSGEFIDKRATDIIKLAISKEVGIINVGGKRKSVYNLVKEIQPDIGKMSIKDIKGIRIPRDVSLNSNKWGKIKF